MVIVLVAIGIPFTLSLVLLEQRVRRYRRGLGEAHELISTLMEGMSVMHKAIQINRQSIDGERDAAGDVIKRTIDGFPKNEQNAVKKALLATWHKQALDGFRRQNSSIAVENKV